VRLYLSDKYLRIELLDTIKTQTVAAFKTARMAAEPTAASGPSKMYGISPYTLLMASSAKTRRIEIRVTDEEHSLEEAAATALGVTLSEFFRRAARESAEEVLAEQSRIVLDDEEAARFLDAIDHPERFETGLAWLADRPSVLPS